MIVYKINQQNDNHHYYLYNYGFDEYDNGWKRSSNRLPVSKTVKVADETSLAIDLGDVYGLSNDVHFLVTFDQGKFTWYEKETNKALTKVYPMHGDHPEIFVVQDRTYTIEFEEIAAQPKIQYNVRDEEEKTEGIVFLGGIASLSYINIDSASLVLTNEENTVTYSDTVDFNADYESGILAIDSLSIIEEGSQYVASYKYYPIYQSKYLDGENDNKIFDGMQIKVTDVSLGVNVGKSGFIVRNSNYAWEVIDSRVYPADFEITFKGNIGDSVNSDNYNVAVPFFIENVTHGDTMGFRVFDQDDDNEWDREEAILIQPYEGMMAPYMFVVFDPYANVTTVIDQGDTTILDTAFSDIVDVEMGDVFRIAIDIPFAEDDKYHFTTISSKISNELASDELDDIAVVPNPYVVAAAWEPRLNYESGRGERKIDFINLPTECTIKIFTLNGYLVNTLDHESINENGTYSWNMLSKDGLELSYGLYMYHVDAEGIGEFTGKFALIK